MFCNDILGLSKTLLDGNTELVSEGIYLLQNLESTFLESRYKN